MYGHLDKICLLCRNYNNIMRDDGTAMRRCNLYTNSSRAVFKYIPSQIPSYHSNRYTQGSGSTCN